jgi:hypothetical protein
VGLEALAGCAVFAEGQGALGLAIQALANERVQRGQAVEQRRGVFGVQWVAGQARVDKGPQAVRGAADLVVLLGRLDDSGEVQPTKALELLGLFGDAIQLAQDVLEELLAIGLAELRFLIRIASRREQAVALVALVAALVAALVVFLVVGLDANGQWLELLLACRGAVAQLLRGLQDEAVDPLQLHVGQLVHKGLLIVVGPCVCLLVVLEQLLQLFVVDVLVFPRRVHALAQGGAELHCRAFVKDSGWAMQGRKHTRLQSSRNERLREFQRRKGLHWESRSIAGGELLQPMSSQSLRTCGAPAAVRHSCGFIPATTERSNHLCTTMHRRPAWHHVGLVADTTSP